MMMSAIPSSRSLQHLCGVMMRHLLKVSPTMLIPVLILSYLNAFVWKECLVKGFTMIAFNESDVLASHGQLKPISIRIYLPFPSHAGFRSASSSSSRNPRPTTSDVSLRLSSLASLHGLQSTGDLSSYATNGVDPQRIKKILASPPCDCGCTMPFKPLLNACRTFWGLSKESQKK